jgi:glycosyltransferase involved in cell wall biosynthesis
VKILQLIDTLDPGGAERMCINISNTLCNNGIDVQLCSTRNGGSLQSELHHGIVYHCLKKKSSIDLKAFRKLIDILKTEKIDLIHAHSTSLFWAVAAKTFNRNLKIIWHDHLGRRINYAKANWIYKLISSKIDAIIAVNMELAEWSRKHMKVPSSRIIFMNNFPLLKETGRHPDPEYFTVVCLANILPVKDHETLIRAIGLINERKLSKPLRIIFAGAYTNDYYISNLKKVINKLNLNSIIEFAGSVDDTAGLLAIADCGVLSSVSEGMPVSLLEYGLARLPVVVTDVGQCAEVVGNGKYGRIVPARDPEAMANELFSIITDSTGSYKMGINLHDHILKNYGPDHFVNEYNILLNKIQGNAQIIFR